MKNIVVTGASGGIGSEIIRKLCNNPDMQVFAIIRDMNKMQSKITDLNISRLHILSADFSDSGNIPDVSSLPEEIHVLINNAGMMLKKSFLEISDEEWKKVFQVNFFSAVRLIKSLLPFMGKSETAHIINISSMGGVQGSVKFAGLSAYAASKAALANLTEVLAVELKDKNVHLNCLALGAVNTEMLNETFPGYQAPLNAGEMAEFIVSFALTGHKYFNGKILPVAVSTP